MCDCNQKRMAFVAGNSRNRAEEDVHRGMNQVKLIQKEALEINGDVTGRTYLLKKKNDIVWVDKRDLSGMKDIKGLKLFF